MAYHDLTKFSKHISLFFSFRAAVGMILIAVVLCLSPGSLCADEPTLETTAPINFVAMKSEAALVKLIQLVDQKDIEGGAEYLRQNGAVIMKGTPLAVLGFGCDGRCVKFRIKGRPTLYWALEADVEEE